MGPRALARGNPPSPAVHSTVATRFNGAARSRARKCLHAVQTALKLDGFNGAARSRARKWRGQSRGAGIREALQWGRALSRAEMDHRETTTVETCFASMGPRALARGNIAFDDIFNSGRLASMGPRALARGNLALEVGSTAAPLALQWGRALSRAEMTERQQ